jgi:hypothetical protein
MHHQHGCDWWQSGLAVPANERRAERMKVKIFALARPHGRSLILMKKLNEFTCLSGTDCVALGQRLFSVVHQRDNPAIVVLRDPGSTEALAASCREFGILIEEVRDGR